MAPNFSKKARKSVSVTVGASPPTKTFRACSDLPPLPAGLEGADKDDDKEPPSVPPPGDEGDAAATIAAPAELACCCCCCLAPPFALLGWSLAPGPPGEPFFDPGGNDGDNAAAAVVAAAAAPLLLLLLLPLPLPLGDRCGDNAAELDAPPSEEPPACCCRGLPWCCWLGECMVAAVAVAAAAVRPPLPGLPTLPAAAAAADDDDDPGDAGLVGDDGGSPVLEIIPTDSGDNDAPAAAAATFAAVAAVVLVTVTPVFTMGAAEVGEVLSRGTARFTSTSRPSSMCFWESTLLAAAEKTIRPSVRPPDSFFGGGRGTNRWFVNKVSSM